MPDVFTPAFSLSDGVRSLLGEIERNHGLLDRVLTLPARQASIRREITLVRADATTRIEGIGEGARHADAAGAQAYDAATANALRAYEFIDYISDLPEQPVDELVIRQLNRDFIHGAAPTLTPGVYRKGQNLVGAYTPPDQGDVPSLMRALVAWIRKTDAHPVIRAGLAHVQFIAIHPFWDGNGRTARGLETLLLQRSALHFRKLLSTEKRLLDVRPQYFMALERTLGGNFGAYDATPWIDFYVGAVAAEVRSLQANLAEYEQQLEAVEQIGGTHALLPRQIDALAFVIRAGSMTRGDYLGITHVSPITGSRDLQLLVEKQLVVAEGKTSSRAYRPSPRLLVAAKRAADPRAKR